MTFSLPKFDSKAWSYLALIFIFTLFIFNIGDISIPRQGTEGFYLEISKEMFSKNSFLTPYYLNEPHFSKPPLQFWITTPFYFIFGESLWAARLAIFVVTCCLIVLTSKLLSRWGSASALSIFILFISSFGVIKYSRIYMMEAFFTFFTGAGTLFAFDYLKNKYFSSLLISAVLLAASALVKGPISLIMALSALFLFILIRDRSLYKNFFKLIILILIPASFWYIACFYQYGSKFIDYFFIRENLGKLTTKSYSLFVLVQGLFLFTFPVFVPYLYFLYRDIRSRAILNLDLNFFLSLCLAIFWIIWFIPSQRSHHYAMPASFFLISYVAVSHFDSPWFNKLINSFSLSLSTLGIFLVILILFFKQSLPIVSYSTSIFVLLFLMVNILLAIFTDGTITLRLAQYTVTFLLIWYHMVSMVALPILPERIRAQLAGSDSRLRIGVVYRKPYFISELLDRDIEALSQDQGHSELSNSAYDFLIMPLTEVSTESNFQKLDSWKVWKRGLGVGEIYDRVKHHDIDQLQETYSLFRRK